MRFVTPTATRVYKSLFLGEGGPNKTSVVCCMTMQSLAQIASVTGSVYIQRRSSRLQSVVGSNPTQGSSSFFLGKRELSWV